MIVLIADDDKIARKLLRVTLQAEDFEVLEAADGQEAFDILQEERVDLLITDILMPNMDGYRLCFEIRKMSRFKTLPIIVYSSTYTSPGDAETTRDLGANEFLAKPAPAAVLVETIRKVTARKERRSSHFKPSDDLYVTRQYNERLVRALEESNRKLLKRTAELAENEEKFRQFADNVHKVFVILNADMSQLVYVNPAYEKIWGRSRESLYERPDSWMDAVHPEDRNRVSANIRESVGKKSELEYRILRPDNAIRWIRARSFPIFDDENHLFRIGVTVEDITEQKNLSEQLRQSQKMEAIGLLAGGVAHDFNNLLTVINGRSQMLINRLPAGDPVRNDLEMIYSTGERAASLTRQLLAFSRQQILQPTILDLNSVVNELAKMLHRLIGEDIALAIALNPRLKPVKADRAQIEQVIMNLVVNARDAMPRGGRLTIETGNIELDETYVSAHPLVAPGKYSMLAINDNGCGMDEKVKARLFEPFFTTKPVGKGTGLGLSTVYGIVKQSDGHISVYSEVGKGTSFKVYLPQVEGKAAASRSKLTAVSKHGTETILLAEDDAGVRDLVCDVLKSMGYAVLANANGAEALACSSKFKGQIHLLMSDVVMPGMSGPDLAKKIREQRQEIKLLFASGYSDQAIVQNGFLAHGAAFIQKPFTPTSLLQKIRAVLDGRGE